MERFKHGYATKHTANANGKEIIKLVAYLNSIDNGINITERW
jgi:hypothetical protein